MLTPLEVENKRFTPKKFKGGYDEIEVDTFLDQLQNDYEKLYRENAELKSKLEDSEKNLEHYKNIEHTLQNTLVMAQTTADDIKNNAQSRAEQIIRDAQSEARRATEEIAKEEFDIRKRTEELKRQFSVYKAKMEALLISQLELLQDDKEDNE
jgi:cell division initiation protein